MPIKRFQNISPTQHLLLHTQIGCKIGYVIQDLQKIYRIDNSTVSNSFDKYLRQIKLMV